jgi:hypothetical protein
MHFCLAKSFLHDKKTYVSISAATAADDLRPLLRFREDFPEAKTHLLYLGKRSWHDRGIEVLPFLDCVTKLDHWL